MFIESEKVLTMPDEIYDDQYASDLAQFNRTRFTIDRVNPTQEEIKKRVGIYCETINDLVKKFIPGSTVKFNLVNPEEQILGIRHDWKISPTAEAHAEFAISFIFIARAEMGPKKLATENFRGMYNMVKQSMLTTPGEQKKAVIDDVAAKLNLPKMRLEDFLPSEKDAGKPAQGNEQQPQQPVKRGRGRPRKNPVTA